MKKSATILLLVFMLVSTVLFSQTPVAPAGSGTSIDPYQIATLDNLAWLSITSGVWGSNFIQTANIDATATSGWNGTAGFSPIGNSGTYFTGNYNGDNFTIDGLYINRPLTDFIGLFGVNSGASIENLGVININYLGYNYIGGLVGYNYNNSSISNSYATGNVIGDLYIGGLVGYNYNNSSITNSYAAGSVTGNQDSGGLVGVNYINSSITNSYATGSVTGNSNTGGLVGYNNNSNSTNCFWDTQTSGQATSALGTGKTTLEMQTQSTFDPPWDFLTVWSISPSYNNGYPNLDDVSLPPPIPLSNSAIYLSLLFIGIFIIIKYRKTVFVKL